MYNLRKKGAESNRLTKIKEVEEFTKCFIDYSYCINNYIRLPNNTTRPLFKLYPFQEAALHELRTKKRVIFLKSRQMGITTLLNAYALLEAMYKPNSYILLVSIKENMAMKMLKMIKEMYLSMPHYVKIPVANKVGVKLGTSLKIEFENGSVIEAQAATENAGRGSAATHVIFDEIAFQQFADEIYTALQPTLAFTNGQFVMNSTPFGVGNLYEKTYVNAIRGFNNFTPLRLHWTLHPDYTVEWYKKQLQELGTKRAKQELDCTFLNAGSPVLHIPTIRSIEEEIKNLETYTRFEALPDGFGGYIYEKPRQDRKYVIGVDVSTGKASDYSAISVMDTEAREVAYYKGKLPLRELATLVIKLAKYFNNALVISENNGVGEGLIELFLEKGFYNLYEQDAIVKPSNNITYVYENKDKYGYNTNLTSRPKLITELDYGLEFNKIATANRFLVKEAYDFIYDSHNRAISASKLSRTSTYDDDYISDDMIFAISLAYKGVKDLRRKFNLDVLSVA
jgi:hypothetical protein